MMRRPSLLLIAALAACGEPRKAPVSADAGPAPAVPAGQPAEPPAAAPAPVPAPDRPAASGDGNAPAAARDHRPTPGCPIGDAGQWTAHIDAMPGPGATPRLVVVGKIRVKPAARTELQLAPEQLESMPPQLIVNLKVRLPQEPTIDMLEQREVRGQWPVTPPIAAVHIRCGDRRLASLGLEAAY